MIILKLKLNKLNEILLELNRKSWRLKILLFKQRWRNKGELSLKLIDFKNWLKKLNKIFLNLWKKLMLSKEKLN